MSSEEVEEIKDILGLKLLGEEVFYYEDKELEEVAEIIQLKSERGGITEPEEAVERYYREAKECLKKLVVERRKMLLKDWIKKVKIELDRELEELKEEDLLKEEGVLEELFYDIVDRAVDKVI
jgi:geranylgeranyl pyrophosphate synthase